MTETSPEKDTIPVTQSESPGIISATPPLRKKKKSTISECETSPSLLTHRRRRKRLSNESNSITEKIGFNCRDFFSTVSPELLPKNKKSPIITKKMKKMSSMDDSFTIEDCNTQPTALKINRTLFLDDEKIEESQNDSMTTIINLRGTQIIDEFDMIAVDSERTKNNGWKSQEKIAEILSAERARRSLCRIGSVVEKKKRKDVKSHTLAEYLEFLSRSQERQCIFDNECRNNGWKDFHILEVFDCAPIMVRASGEEGIAIILLTEDVLKNQNALQAGSILRVYAPWIILKDGDDELDEVFYTFVSGCDVRCVEGRRVEEKVQLREIPIDLFVSDSGMLVRVLLGNDEDDC